MKFDELAAHDVAHGEHISDVLDQLARHQPEPWEEDFRSAIGKGIGFITFAFDIDGVSMEVAKYARCFEAISPGVPIHCIAGNFGSKVAKTRIVEDFPAPLGPIKPNTSPLGISSEMPFTASNLP